MQKRPFEVPETAMKIELAFGPMIEIEMELSRLYAAWAELFESDHEASFSFYKMSQEEKGHAELVEYQRRIFKKNRQMSVEVKIDLTALEATIEQVRALRSGPPPRSVAEAITIALDLESSAAECHFSNALKQADPELERLLRSLAGDERAHQAKLTTFAETRGIRLTSARTSPDQETVSAFVGSSENPRPKADIPMRDRFRIG